MAFSRLTALHRHAEIGAAGNRFQNKNLNGLEIHHGHHTELMYRADWTFQRSSQLMFEGGAEIRRSRASHLLGSLRSAVRSSSCAKTTASTTHPSSYVLARITKGRTSIAPGVRVDHSTLTGHTSASPWIETRWPLPASLAARAGGIYRQEPDFAELAGRRGAALNAFRSYHVDAGVEGPLGRSTSWQLSAYNRQDYDYPWLPNAQFRAENGRLFRLSPPVMRTRSTHSRRGRARATAVLPDDSRISHGPAFTDYRNTLTGEDFSADYDQRHTLNVYGVLIQRSDELQHAFPRRQQLPGARLLRRART